jgi:hypothetical protein
MPYGAKLSFTQFSFILVIKGLNVKFLYCIPLDMVFPFPSQKCHTHKNTHTHTHTHTHTETWIRFLVKFNP